MSIYKYLLQKIDFLALILGSFFILSYFFIRGFIFIDEGYFLHASQRFIHGQIPYKDFDFIYTPGTLFITGLFFKIFGESIVTGRILILLIGIASSCMIYILTRHISKNKIFPYLSVFIYLSWLPTHINFPWPVTFAIFTGLITLYYFLPKNQNLFLAGFFAFFTFLFKQNFGVAVLANSFLIFIFNKRLKNFKYAFKFLLGFLTLALLFLIYLLKTDSLFSFFNTLITSTSKIVLEGNLSNSFPKLENNIRSTFKFFFYLSPIIFSLFALINSRKHFFLTSFVMTFYLFGIRPMTDYTHLIPLVSIMGFSLIALAENKSKIIKIPTHAFIIVTIFLGFYTALFYNYYRWESPIITNRYFNKDQRIRIFTNEKYKKALTEIIYIINKKTGKNDYIFVFPHAPIFYFIADRKNPTRHIDTAFLKFFSEKQQEKAINDLKNKSVELILTHWDKKDWGIPIVEDYILKNYAPTYQIYEFTIWLKK